MIIAKVIYWQAGAENLRRLVRSLEGRVDAAVFLDGMFEGIRGPVGSPAADRRAIVKACDAINLPAYVPPAPSVPWPSEPIKRTVAARLAWEEFGHEYGHNLLVIDADEELLTPVPPLEPGRLAAPALIDDETPAMQRACQHPQACTSPECECELRMVRRLCEEPTRETCRNPWCECPPILGATMLRLHQLTPDITWGPSHFEITSGGQRYSTPHCLPSNPHSFVIKHWGQTVKADRSYQAYNDHQRMRIEATDPRLPGADPIPTWGYQSRDDTIAGGLASSQDKVRVVLPAPRTHVTPRDATD